MHSRRRGFTLVEILVVIGIIAVLIAVLLPTLQKVRSAGNRAVCLSNERQLLLAMQLYANMSKQQLPPGLDGCNFWQGNFIYRDPSALNNSGYPNGVRPWHNNGWCLLGHTVAANIIKDAKCFYCPEHGGLYTYPAAWENPSSKWITYMFRYTSNIKSQKLGKLKANIALIADHFDGAPFGSLASWPHTKPYGLCVGYVDGHAQYWNMTYKDYITLRNLTLQSQVDLYISLMFQGFDTGDFTAARKQFP